MKLAMSLVTMFIQLPIWFYIVYYILTTIQASELVMFLFWIYIPASLFVNIIVGVLQHENK